MSCCTQYIDLGCFGSCEIVQIGQNYVQSGIHTLQFRFNNFNLNINKNVLTGDAIEIDTSFLNENTCIDFRIKQPDGTYYAVGGVSCFRLNTDLFYAD